MRNYLMLILIILAQHSALAKVQNSSKLKCPAGSKENSREIKTGKIEECLSIASGTAEGPRFEYDEKNVLRRSWIFKDGVPDGEFKVYDDKAILVRQGTFEKGKLTGKLTRWFAKNKIQDETYWVDGRPQGTMKRFFKNGKIMEQGEYKAGRRVGEWNFNQEDGAKLANKNYGDGPKGSLRLLDWTAEVAVQGKNPDDLIWSPKADVEEMQAEKRDEKLTEKTTQLMARVDIEAKQKGWKFKISEQTFSAWDLDERKFTLDVTLKDAETKIEVDAISPEGKKSSIDIILKAAKLAPEGSVAQGQGAMPSVKLSQLWIGAGIASKSYKEGSAIDLKSSSLRIGAEYERQMKSFVSDLQSAFFYDVTSLSQTTGTAKISFIDANAALGKNTNFDSETWKLKIFAGLFYRSTSSSGSTFGYKNLSGIELFPELTYSLANQQKLIGRFHYSPLFGEGFGFAPSAEVETAFDFGYQRALSSGRDLRLMIYLNSLKIETTSTSLKTQSSGAFVSYGF
jgi:hypothetical protein